MRPAPYIPRLPEQQPEQEPQLIRGMLIAVPVSLLLWTALVLVALKIGGAW